MMLCEQSKRSYGLATENILLTLHLYPSSPAYFNKRLPPIENPKPNIY